ncbi:unnamed protein product [Spirodela intermedia]|uniref:Uncharacterized protein n=1 Tax=Spirodela intermedia TaxID=51605 RepID=A0A7I8J0Q2_SPIIN|nr:unnamed protein product [Spirodela intermedia]CAA6663718.1 unnamed protein product [Spirodela intermedia]
MGGRHLYEILREDQEPFLPSSDTSSPPRAPFQQRPRHTPPPSASSLLRSSSASLAHFRSCSVKRRSLLSCLALAKNPFSSARISTAFLLETVSRSTNDQKQERQQLQPNRKKRRRSRKGGVNADDSSVNVVHSGFVDFLVKRLSSQKRHLGIAGGEKVEGESSKISDEDPLGGEDDRATSDTARGSEEEVHSGEPLPDKFGPRPTGEGKEGRSPVSCRCGLPECPLYDGGRPPPAFDGGYALGEGPAIVSSSCDDAEPGSPATPPRRRHRRPSPSRVLFGERAGAPLEGEEKEQLSPVSVLDLPFYEEEDGRRRGTAEGDAADPAVADDDDSFQRRLATLQIAAQNLQLERLADLDPVALDRRLDDEGDRSPDSTMRRRLEPWKGVESDTVDVMVKLDLREEGDARRECQEQVPEVAAELSAVVFSVLCTSSPWSCR